jgi:hypothetical protein
MQFQHAAITIQGCTGDLLIATSTRLSELQSWCFSGLLEAMALEAMPTTCQHDKSAICIQKQWRGSIVRVSIRASQASSIRIQALVRGTTVGQSKIMLTSGSWLQYVFSDIGAGVSLALTSSPSHFGHTTSDSPWFPSARLKAAKLP